MCYNWWKDDHMTISKVDEYVSPTKCNILRTCRVKGQRLSLWDQRIFTANVTKSLKSILHEFKIWWIWFNFNLTQCSKSFWSQMDNCQQLGYYNLYTVSSWTCILLLQLIYDKSDISEHQFKSWNHSCTIKLLKLFYNKITRQAAVTQSSTTTSSFNSWRRFSSIRACTSDRFDNDFSCYIHNTNSTIK